MYTKTEVDANHYTKTEVDANHYTKTEVDANHYTKTEVDANHYTKTEVDDNHYTKTEVDASHYTKTEVDGALGDRETSTFTDQEEVIDGVTNEVTTPRTVRSITDVIGAPQNDGFFNFSSGDSIVGKLETATNLIGDTSSTYFIDSDKGASNVISKLENLNTRLEATYNKTEVDSELDLIDGAITNLNVGLKDTYRKSEVDGALGDRETSTFTDQEEVIDGVTNEVTTARHCAQHHRRDWCSGNRWFLHKYGQHCPQARNPEHRPWRYLQEIGCVHTKPRFRS